MSQEECARLRECVPYVKVYRYNPKHLCPNLNGYVDNGRRKMWSSGGSTHCTCQLTFLSMSVLIMVSYYGNSAVKQVLYFSAVMYYAYTRMRSQPCYVSARHSFVMYSTWNPKDNYGMSVSVFVVQFNGFMSLTS